jgi:hypothetical protein
MKTSWNETELIEKHIRGFSDTGDALLFEAQLILDSNLSDRVQWQRSTYEIIHNYGRRQLKKEIEAVHQKLFTQPAYLSFSQKIRILFTNL